MRQTIARVALVVPDYDAGIAFYCGKLGFDLVEDTRLDDSKRWVVVRPKGRSRLRCCSPRPTANASRRRSATRPVVASASSSSPTISPATMQRCWPPASSFLEAPRHEPYGVVAVFSDPFGNHWDLLQPAA